jgi:hypothetical protein
LGAVSPFLTPSRDGRRPSMATRRRPGL